MLPDQASRTVAVVMGALPAPTPLSFRQPRIHMARELECKLSA
jgi:hypothetical protein